MDSKAFLFVSDSRYKRILENDYEEIKKDIDNGCYKSSTTISGSLIEALLTDYLIDMKITKIPDVRTGKDVAVENAGLKNINEYCKINSFVSTRVYYLLEAIRDFRNLIHPAKAVRMEIEVTKDDANLYKSTLDIIIAEISKIRQSELGSTAEQLLHFMINDEHAVELFDHMIQKVKNEEEKRKYLLEIIPKELESTFKEKWSYFDEDGPKYDTYEEGKYVEILEKKISDLIESFNICFFSSKSDTKKSAANRMIEVLRNGTTAEKDVYKELFEEEYIDLLEKADKTFIIDYIIINSKQLTENQFRKILNKFANETSKEKRYKILENTIYMIKIRNYKELNEAIYKYLCDIKKIDIVEYNSYIKIISDLVKDDFDKDTLTLNDLISDILTRLGEPVPNYIPF